LVSNVVLYYLICIQLVIKNYFYCLWSSLLIFLAPKCPKLNLSIKSIISWNSDTMCSWRSFRNFWRTELPPSSIWVWVRVTLRPTVSRSVRLGVEPHLGLMTKYYVLLDSYGFVSRALSLTRGRICHSPSSGNEWYGYRHGRSHDRANVDMEKRKEWSPLN
jgi:hypothetical protein